MTSAPSPLFSVVIPTFNRVKTLRRVLVALASQENPPTFEVVIVNDGSTDGTDAFLRDVKEQSHPFQVQIETQKNGGPGRARNRGVALANGKVIVFIGDDTVPQPRFLAQHSLVHSRHDHNRLVACLGYTGWPPRETVTSFMDYINDYGLQFGYKLIQDQEEVPFNFFYTSNLSLHRELLLENPFDTSFPAAAWEDIELAYRLRSKGLRILYNASAVTHHYHPISVDSFAARQYKVGRSGAIFFRKHPDLGHFLGVHELTDRPLATDSEMKWLRRRARLAEKIRFLARASAFEPLMRQHYLRGLQDGLTEMETVD